MGTKARKNGKVEGVDIYMGGTVGKDATDLCEKAFPVDLQPVLQGFTHQFGAKPRQEVLVSTYS